MKILHKENCSGIYLITNLVNNKKYIGSSIQIYYRTRRHLSDLRKNRHKNPILQNSFNKHGEKNFKIDIVFKTSNNLEEYEKYYIEFYNCEYNIQKDPVKQSKTKEMRIKISNSLKQGYLDGTILPTKTRSITVYDSNGKFVKVFPQFIQCLAELKISSTRAGAVLRKKQLHTKGYQLFYTNELNHNVKILNLKIGNSGYLEQIKSCSPIKIL